MLEDLEAPYVLQGSPKAELALLARLYYFGRNGREQVIKKLHISRSSLYNRRQALVRLLIQYMEKGNSGNAGQEERHEEPHEKRHTENSTEPA